MALILILVLRAEIAADFMITRFFNNGGLDCFSGRLLFSKGFDFNLAGFLIVFYSGCGSGDP
jgi:hypothetical protein